MDILKIATAGSVDDGKSTLIGRLLLDTGSVAKDKLDAVELSSKRKGLDFTDLSMLTDGLIAEREQGITIDVAHIYFATAKRKYIIADTPGHIEYTRNMITGASNAQTTIVLIDARNGVTEQTRRHLYISNMLCIEHVFVCINKMDLVGFDEQIFLSIKSRVEELSDKIRSNNQLHFIPMVAKDGDNVALKSEKISWYRGISLLEYLEGLPVHTKEENLPARFPVQMVIRPLSGQHHDFRGYAGKLVSGKLRTGQEITVLPSLRNSVIRKIFHNEKEINEAIAGQSICIELDEDIDISRGYMIVASNDPFVQSTHLIATIAWMNEEVLSGGRTFLIQHGIHISRARVTHLLSKLDMDSMEEIQEFSNFRLNDIGRVMIKTPKPVFPDLFKNNPANGSFILIDEFSNNTVAVGFVEGG